MALNAYTLKCLPEMGVDVGNLGCVMLDVDLFPGPAMLPEEWAYTSQHPKLGHVDGIQREFHLTLLYGLLQNANAIRDAVDEVLDGWEPEPVQIKTYTFFPSAIPGEDYGCIIARPMSSGALLDAHQRLSFLPHVNTHQVYSPHITVGYVQKQFISRAVDLLNGSGKTWATPRGLNYGRLPQG